MICGSDDIRPRGVARSKTVGWTEGVSRTHGERAARAYNGGKGRSSPEAESILPLNHPNEGQNMPL